MAHNYTTCENGHGGPNVLQSLGWEGRVNELRCTECNTVFEADHSGDEVALSYEDESDDERQTEVTEVDNE